jgi:hypothetical protein
MIDDLTIDGAIDDWYIPSSMGHRVIDWSMGPSIGPYHIRWIHGAIDEQICQLMTR